MTDYPTLTIEIKNTKPIELLDLTNSLLGISDEYKRFIARSQSETEDELKEIKLYVKEIRSGSIVTDIIAMAPVAIPLIQTTNTLVAFTGYIKTGLDYLLGKTSDKDNLTKQNLDNPSTFLEPVAKDTGSQMMLQVTVNGNNNKIYNINSLEANAAQNRAKKEIEALKEPITGVRERELLYWYQARNDSKSQAGDKAIIEIIRKSPVKTVFFSEKVKSEMLYATENPFRKAYIVDVRVDTINDRPAVYTILKVHDTFDRPLDTEIEH